ncbi:MAG: hypothetical protein P1U83_14010 [Roseovarius sp.]|nr:hypothetical protein [Roseovarius sp.]
MRLWHLQKIGAHIGKQIATLVKPGGFLICKTPCLVQLGLSLKLRLMLKQIPILQFFNKAPYVCLLTSKAL